MKHLLLMAGIVLSSLNTYALDDVGLSGTVVNEQGTPITGAQVKANNTKKAVVTDSQGRFSLSDKNIVNESAQGRSESNNIEEIHVTAPGYSHRMVHLHEEDSETLVITLASTVIEQVDVIGLPIHASVIESALPVSVLTGEKLRNQQAATLGDTLGGLPGVNSNFHGHVSSTPVIRGLSGPRVLITQNSLDVSDVSRVGPDHSVASEVSTAQQVEVLRGPATLFYGSGAIGGVVNVVDKRVPTDSQTQGEFLLGHDSVNKQNQVSFNAGAGIDSVAFYADGFWREADNYKVPVTPEQDHENENENIVANSAEESSGYTLGGSYLLDNGYVGISLGHLEREYGIPGHSHGGHIHEEGDESDEGEEGEEGEKERVYADLKQDRYQLQSEWDVDLFWLRGINTRAAYTDYSHAEIEEGVVGTLFSNQTSEVRVDLLHQEWAHWRGGVNFHYKKSDIAAEGDEAFTPPSTSETFAIALMEEKHMGGVLVQMGARIERVTIAAEDVLLPYLDVHMHDAPDVGIPDSGDHDHDHEDEGTRVFKVDHDFTPVSLSFGAVWDFRPGYNVGVSLSYSQRAPSASELLSFGPHIGTRSYEIGALFALHDEDGDTHFELSEADVELERSNNIDLSFRKHEGDIGIILNVFYNQINDYYYQRATGLFAQSVHAHEEDHNHDTHDDDHESEEHEGEEHEGEEHVDELPVYLFAHADAELYGFEAQGIWKLNDRWKTTVFSDYVHAELTDGTYLPRTPPWRMGLDLDYMGEHLNATLSWVHYTQQNKTAPLETPTDSYDMLNATFNYRLPTAAELTLFLNIENITDAEARVHTSFIKDIAPRPGRNFALGIRGTF